MSILGLGVEKCSLSSWASRVLIAASRSVSPDLAPSVGMEMWLDAGTDGVRDSDGILVTGDERNGTLNVSSPVELLSIEGKTVSEGN
jgi:hypothetical protein